MAQLTDINALLAALKSREGSSSALPADDDADPTADDSAAPEDEGSDEDSAEDNAKIVSALQDQYPSIFAKLSKQIEADDGSGGADDTDGSDMSSLGEMSGMMK